jgi:plastocyanin
MDRERRTMARRLLVVLMGALLVMGAACGDDGGTDPQAEETEAGEDEPTGEPAEAEGGALEIEGVDFAFKTPTTATAGETEITFTNAGKEPHQLILALLADDAPDVAELIKLPEKKANSFLVEQIEDGAKPIKPGDSVTFTAELKPGTYGMVCFVPSKEKKQPHAFLGMYNSITVE